MADSSILSAIRAELKSLSALAEIRVVECDVHIRREYAYRGEIDQVAGGGGTSFHEPLAREFLAKRRVDAVFYFTDGCGPAPAKRPTVPIVWCLVGPWARKPAAYGKELRIQVSDDVGH